MKKIIFAFVCVILTFNIYAQENVEDESTNVIVKNETGNNLKYLYLSPSSHDDWEDDFLNGIALGDEESTKIHLGRDIDEDQVLYDLQAIDENDNYYTIYEINISDLENIEITMDDFDGASDASDNSSLYNDNTVIFNKGYSEGYKDGYKEAFRDAYLEGFKAGMNTAVPEELE